MPIITQRDLDAYHKQHFPSTRSPAPLRQSSPEDNESHEEDDDGLGYYDDGVKRTLTDEQIAMFRHSEIQALLRERRLAREAASDDDAGTSAVDVTDSTTESAPLEPAADQSRMVQAKQADPHTSSYGRVHGEPPQKKKKRTHRAMTAKQKRKAGLLQPQITSPTSNAVMETKPDLSSRRHSDDVRTQNRRARGLDEAEAENVDLDY